MGAKNQNTGLTAHVKTAAPPAGNIVADDSRRQRLFLQRVYQSAFLGVYSVPDCERPGWVPPR